MAEDQSAAGIRCHGKAERQHRAGADEQKPPCRAEGFPLRPFSRRQRNGIRRVQRAERLFIKFSVIHPSKPPVTLLSAVCDPGKGAPLRLLP